MAVTVGTDSYVSEDELTAYADARGVVILGDKTVLLIKAMDYIGTRSFAGTKTDEAQKLHFPVDGATEVPANIKMAQIAAALLIDSGVDLFAPIERALKRKEIAGVIDKEYMDNASETTKYPQLIALLAPYLSSSGGFEVVRG